MNATQIVAGVEMPAAGTWSVDPDHTEVAFIGRHLGLAKSRGHFAAVDATVHIAEDPAESLIDVTIDMASIESGSTARDASLRSEMWFDVDNHPTARFRSTVITLDGTGGTVSGDLTIKGVTRQVDLDVEYLGAARDPWGNDRVAFSATATVNREDWGITNSMTLDNGRLPVSRRIQVEIDLELIRQEGNK
jgi:polyisoprenoid-binding protein YceI